MRSNIKKIILILIGIIILVSIMQRCLEKRYMQIGPESKLIINGSADVYIDEIRVRYDAGNTLEYSIVSIGSNEFIAGYSGILEYEKNGLWYTLAYKHPPFSEQPIYCDPNDTVYREFAAEWHYGKLRDGHYRFIRPIGEKGADSPYLISIEFDIK